MDRGAQVDWESLCDICCAGGMTFYGLPLCAPPAGIAVRAAMRNRYNIKGSLCKDIIAACCCGCCSWCLMHRELKHRKKTPTFVNVQYTNVLTSQPAPLMMMMPQPVMSNQQVTAASN